MSPFTEGDAAAAGPAGERSDEVAIGGRARSPATLAALPLEATVGSRGAAARPAAAGRGAATAPDAVPRFDHVVLIVLENHSRAQVLGNRAAPYFDRLSRRYATLTRYVAVAHPSLPNYLALVSGSTHGVRSDCLDCLFRAPSLADTLRARHDRWRVYVEGRPHTLGDVDVRSLKARIPFLFFADVVSRPALLRSEIVPLGRLATDLRRRQAARLLPGRPEPLPRDARLPGAPRRRVAADVPAAAPRSTIRARNVVFVVFDESRTRDVAGGGGAVARSARAARAAGRARRGAARPLLAASHHRGRARARAPRPQQRRTADHRKWAVSASISSGVPGTGTRVAVSRPSTSSTVACSTFGAVSRARSISSGSMRWPRILSWRSVRPTKVSDPSGRRRQRSPVAYIRWSGRCARGSGRKRCCIRSGRCR